MVVKNPYRMAVVAVVTAAALVLGGCSGSSKGPASSDSAGGVEIKPTGTITRWSATRLGMAGS